MYNEEAYQETTTQSPGKERKRSFAFLGGFLTALVLVGVVFAIYHFMFNKEAEIRRIIRDQYIGDVSEEAIEEGKYYGMVDALDDKYSKYFNKEEYQELYQNTHGVFVGLGIVFLSSDDGKELVIADIYEGAPADGCGLAVGDRVVTINGEAPGDGFTVDALSAGMQSGEIKEVTIVVTREGTEEPIEAVITLLAMRNSFVPPTVGYQVPDPDCDLDYVPNVGREMEIRNALSTTSVQAPRDGVVIQTLPLGTEFKAGQPVAWLLPQAQQMTGREMLCYVTYDDLRKLKIGQQVQATPANMERENWGYAYGRVVGIEQYPTTRQEIVNRVKLDPLAAFIPDGQAMYEVRVTLDTQDGGLVWSREKSRDVNVGNGALCNIQIITRKKPVWRVLVGTIENTVESIMGN